MAQREASTHRTSTVDRERARAFLWCTARLVLMVERAEGEFLHFVPGRPLGSNRANAKYFVLKNLRRGPARRRFGQGRVRILMGREGSAKATRPNRFFISGSVYGNGGGRVNLVCPFQNGKMQGARSGST